MGTEYNEGEVLTAKDGQMDVPEGDLTLVAQEKEQDESCSDPESDSGPIVEKTSSIVSPVQERRRTPEDSTVQEHVAELSALDPQAPLGSGEVDMDKQESLVSTTSSGQGN